MEGFRLDSSLLTTEVCVGSVVLVTVFAVIAAAFTIYRQKRLMGSEREEGEGEEKEGNSARDEVDDDIFTGRWPTNKESEEVESSGETRRHIKKDPLEFCEHIPGEMKKVKQRMAVKKVEEEMTEDQREMEREVKQQQMEAIFRLLKEQEDKFGIGSADEMDRQMNAYYNIN